MSVFTDFRFDYDDIRLKVQSTYDTTDGKKGIIIGFVDARTIMDALDEVCDKWETTIEHFGQLTFGQAGKNQTKTQVAVTLSVTRETDDAVAPYDNYTTKTDVGLGVNAKDATSDGLKRAAAQLGVGRYIWKIGNIHAFLTKGDYPKIPKENENKVKAHLLREYYKNGKRIE